MFMNLQIIYVCIVEDLQISAEVQYISAIEIERANKVFNPNGGVGMETRHSSENRLPFLKRNDLTFSSTLSRMRFGPG